MSNANWKEWLEQERENALDEKWDFSKFKILCSFCNSTNVEINGEGESEGGYYAGDASHSGSILVKCHGCGKAMRIDIGSWWELEQLNNDVNVLKGETGGENE